MKKNFVRLATVMGAVLGTMTMASLAAVGCSDDDVDATTPDASNETSNNNDAKPADDGPTPSDTSTKDSATDAGVDTGPPFDAGPPSFLTYPLQVNRIYCEKLAQCCGGAASFDVEKCTRLSATEPQFSGFAGTRLTAAFLDGGNVTFDQATAQACFNDINNLSCGAVSATSWNKAQQDCLGALTGTLDAGATGCRGSIECKGPSHCTVAADSGTCEPPNGAGVGCVGATYFGSQENCGYIYSGIPRYCDTSLNYPGTAPTNACADRKANGQLCYDNVECQSGICNPATTSGVCATSLTTLINSASCQFYKIVDAGADGG